MPHHICDPRDISFGGSYIITTRAMIHTHKYNLVHPRGLGSLRPMGSEVGVADLEGGIWSWDGRKGAPGSDGGSIEACIANLFGSGSRMDTVLKRGYR